MKYLLKFLIMFFVLFCVWVCDKVIYTALVIWHFRLNVGCPYFTGAQGKPISLKEAWKDIIDFTKKDCK